MKNFKTHINTPLLFRLEALVVVAPMEAIHLSIINLLIECIPDTESKTLFIRIL